MKHRPLLRTSLALAAGLPATQAAMAQDASTASNRRPNILFIMADDQADWTIAAAGYPNTFTPELDRLAQGGVLIRNAFAAAAVCSPARAGVISGRYSSEVGIENFLSDGARGIPADVITWPRVLRDAGYRTAMVGKWHLGDHEDADLPPAKGYEFFSGWPTGGKTSRDPSICVEGQWQDFKGEYTSDVLAGLAMEYMERFKDEPFAISLHFWAPHANQGVPADYKLPYDDRTWLPMRDEDLAPWRKMELALPEPDFPNLDVPRVERMMREYYASVRSNDRNVGRILAKLDELGLTENTIVIYSSDHGYMIGHHGLWHKGSGWWITTDGKDPAGIYNDLMDDRPLIVRDNLYDNSIRVPAIIRWPARLKAGTQTTETFTHLDWFPTLLAMAGVEAPQGAVLRGKNYLPVLIGQATDWDNDLVAQHRKLRCYRTSQWKLVRDFTRLGRDELYRYPDDPQERHNLIASDDPQIVAVRRDLDGRLRRQMKQINDPLYPYAEAWPLD
ncbi:MAG: sulfatase-like hydrolase/transferase [Phycisphaeraceae bacterium]|nr:sulfatase-like hydrolase/transferase [Phycisphaeraceae bacterium]